MTPTSGLPVCEPVFDLLRGAARLGPEPKTETLLSRTTFLYEWVYDSLMSCLKAKESHRRCSVLEVSVTLGAEQAGTRDQKLAHPDQRLAVPAYVSRARSGVYGGVRWAYGWCTESVRFVYGIVRFSDGPRRPWKDFTVWPIDAEQGGNRVPVNPREKASHSVEVQRAWAVAAPGWRQQNAGHGRREGVRSSEGPPFEFRQRAPNQPAGSRTPGNPPRRCRSDP